MIVVKRALAINADYSNYRGTTESLEQVGRAGDESRNHYKSSHLSKLLLHAGKLSELRAKRNYIC